MELIDYAKAYLERGFSIIPISHGTKEAKIRWGQYQEKLPTYTEIERWFSNNNVNIAIVCGKISGGDYWLVVTEVDSVSNYEKFKGLAEEKLRLRLADITPIVRTSRGYHIYWLVRQPVKSAKFPNLEIRSDGNYVLVPPSVHPGGRTYEWLNPNVKSPFVIDSLLDIDIDINQTKSQSPDGKPTWITEAMKGVKEGARDITCARLAGYFLKSNSPDIVKTLLYSFAEKCEQAPNNTFTSRDVDRIVESINRKESLNTPTGDKSFNNTSKGGRGSGDICSKNNPSSYENDDKRRQSDKEMVVKSTMTTKDDNDDNSEGFLYRQQQEEINSFIELSENMSFTSGQIDSQFGYTDRKQKKNRWRILERLIPDVLEKLGVGKYRSILTESEEMQWWTASDKDLVDVKFPLELEKYVKTYPKSLIVLAGVTGAGKTAYSMAFTLLNMNNKMGVHLWTNDMTEVETLERFNNSGVYIPKPPPFKVYYRDDNFHDVIVPDSINIIDYLDKNKDLFMVGEDLDKIHKKLGKGIALVLIQKDPFKEQGLGGLFSKKRCKLYLTLDKLREENHYQLVITKCRGRRKRELNPEKMYFKFELVDGIKFRFEESGKLEG